MAGFQERCCLNNKMWVELQKTFQAGQIYVKKKKLVESCKFMTKLVGNQNFSKKNYDSKKEPNFP